MNTPDSVTVYTDGACRGNPGRGGWAWAVPGGAYASGADAATTNQRMEIKAALEAVRYWTGRGVGEIEVVSDSTYVVNCFRDRWWQGWLRRGWLNSQKKPVANRDLWEPLIELAVGSSGAEAGAESRARPRVTWRWVKGHSGDRWNDLVDELATAAADSGHGASSQEA
jgi:ribonuclease HI